MSHATADLRQILSSRWSGPPSGLAAPSGSLSAPIEAAPRRPQPATSPAASSGSRKAATLLGSLLQARSLLPAGGSHGLVDDLESGLGPDTDPGPGPGP